MPQDAPRITDLSSLYAEDIKMRNTVIMNSDRQPYDILDHQTWQDVRHRIWVTRNGDIRRVFEDFPRDDPLVEQCAGWVHAIAGRHFFPDANHRTAIATLRTLLRQNGIAPGRWPTHLSKEATIRSHTVREEIENICLDTLYRRDRMFLVWVLYFKQVLRLSADEN